jgi:haloalkane dehalogenase
MKIAVMGAGAVGCYYGFKLARGGHRVVLIGRPQHVEAIERQGLRLETQTFDEHVRVSASTPSGPRVVTTLKMPRRPRPKGNNQIWRYAMSEATLTKASVDASGLRMACHQSGQGEPVLFLHGNPTSSYLWRDVIPSLRSTGRIIAPDLIGMGDSDKLPDPGPSTYSFLTHRKYLWALIDKVISPEEKVVLVIHDWGSALGFDWAFHNPDRVRGIAYMEGIVCPIKDWGDWNKAAVSIFQGFRSEKGEELILDRNLFIEKVLPGSVIRKLSDIEMTEYRRPFLKREDRWPMLTWPRQIPIGGNPSDVVAIADAYARWMAENKIPKLFVNAEPGAILTGAARDFCRTWKNQTEVTVAGTHFIQEDSGEKIGLAIAEWMKTALG